MDILTLLAPVFLMVFAGWVFAYAKLLPADVSKYFIAFVYYLAAPVLIYHSILMYPLENLLYFKFWVAYTGVIVAILTVAFLFFWKGMGYTKISSFFLGICSSFANTLMVGYPILAGMVGERAILPVTITLILFNLVFTPIVILCMELSLPEEKRQSSLVGFLKTLAVNPIIISVILGLITAGLDLTLPVFVDKTLGYIGSAVIPVALFSVGLDLSTLNIKANLKDLSIVTVLNLVAKPALAIWVALFFELETMYAAALVIFSSIPTAKLIYVFANKYQVKVAESAATIGITTIGSAFTMPIVLYIVKAIWEIS